VEQPQPKDDTPTSRTRFIGERKSFGREEGVAPGGMLYFGQHDRKRRVGLTKNMRVLFDPRLEGAVNMGRDEALLDFVRRGRSPMTLRVYGWGAPTISLGASQSYQGSLDLTGPVGGLSVVRRRTGGGAILHDAELTYSMTIHKRDYPQGSPTEVYRLLQEAIVETLCELDLPAVLRPRGEAPGPIAQRDIVWCFDRKYDYDIMVAGRKMGGSAQRRLPDALLQHGSIMLRHTFEQHPGTTMDAFMEPIDVEPLARRFMRQVEQRFRCDAEDGVWRDEELRAAEPLAAEHRAMEWLNSR
jgi:lipoate-protein ligase A